MSLIASSYGKARVRVMRVHRGEQHGIRELSVQVMLQGAFDRCYTDADNRGVVATDTIRNCVNIVARDYPQAESEAFCAHVAERLLDRYPQIERVSIDTAETRWRRMEFRGAPHPHGFVLDANGQPTVDLACSRTGSTLQSGIDNYTFLKSTASGWTDFLIDDYTTLPQTRDRIAATSMNATWVWHAPPADPVGTNALILNTMLEVFATTYSHSVQDSLYRMGDAALSAVPAIASIALACPNKHYLPIDLSRFGMASDNIVFTPTDEPHGQIACTLAR